MATVSITNQTLTLTIDINGVETVIRKDNCKVVAIGDVVRITDYRGSIYEFLYSDCTAPDEASANDLRDAIEAFLNTAGGGGGGGLSSIESTTLDVSISDGVATVDGIGGDFTSSVVISNETDCTATCLRALYSRVNNIVTCSYYLGIGLDATFTSGGFNVSLPIPTNFSNARDAFGVITPITDPYSRLVIAITGADTATNEISFTIELDTQGASLTFVANIQYIILP
jgi:hypothetical protein